MTDAVQCIFRICVCGSHLAGKGTLINRITNNYFAANMASTIGIMYHSLTVETDDGIAVRLSINDLAGQERFRSVCSTAYRGSAAVVIVFDISTPPKYPSEDAEYWIEQVRQNAPRNAPVLLVASKVEGMSHDARIEGIKWHGVNDAMQSHAYGGKVFCASAKTGEGVDEIVRELVRIGTMTTAYQDVAAHSVKEAARAKRRHVGKGAPITSDAAPELSPLTRSRRSPASKSSESLLSVVTGVDGKPHVVMSPALVSLTESGPARGSGSSQRRASAGSPVQLDELPRASGSGACVC